MPEINPLTNNQIFLKKIAENTGSEYETGDVSEINPLTIDQIFLKEIAANTAGQSGDISELEGKVADNTSAIEAIVNVTGSCNIFPIGNTQTIHGRTFTVNSDGSITVSGSGDGVNAFYVVTPQKLNVDDHYILKGCPSGGSEYSYSLMYSNNVDNNYSDYGDGVEFVPFDYTIYPTQSVAIYINGNYVIQGTLTFYPMLYDARLNPTGYVPYSMTNRELTDAVNRGSVSVTTNGVKTWQQIFNDLYALLDMAKITNQTLLTIGSDICQLTGSSHPAGLLFVSSGFGANGSALYAWIQRMRIHSSDSSYFLYLTNTSTASDESNNVPSSGITITLYY